MSIAIRFDGVSKRYLAGANHTSLREAITDLPGRLFGRINGREKPDEVWALKELSFQVEKGEALGIIGPNGAGKTTTLRLLSKITRPTAGEIEADGRISALIELGAGFHPDLPGSDNVYLNAAILGLNRSEIRRRYDQIVEFAGLADFMSTPVKRYSSGMYARLGFAIAAHVDPDILLVDEVLAVGDEAFQLKCRDFIHTFVSSGRTSIFVSHNLYAIEQLCDRVLWLEAGEIIEVGKPGPVLRSYMNRTDEKLSRVSTPDAGAAQESFAIHRCVVTDANGSSRENFQEGEDICVELEFGSKPGLGRPFFIVWISEARNNLPIFAANMLLDDYQLSHSGEKGTLVCRFRDVPLMPRAYNIWVEVYGEDRSQILYSWKVVGGFRISDDGSMERDDSQLERGAVRFQRAHGIVRVPYEWHTPSE